MRTNALQSLRSRVDKIARVTADILDDYRILLSPVSYDLHEAEMNIKWHSFFFEEVQREGIPI